MILTLEVSGPREGPAPPESRHAFTTSGGVLGRATSCDWILPHPKVSGRHATVSFLDGVFYIEDTSTNGIAINSQGNRLVRGRRYALQAGDRLLIDPYEIDVSVSGSEAAAGSAHAGESPFGSFPAPGSPLGVVGSAERDRPESSFEEVDPLMLIGGGSSRPPVRQGPTAADLQHRSVMSDHFEPPAVVVPPSPPQAPPSANSFAIPADYNPLDDDFLSPPAPAPHVAAPGPPPFAPRTPEPFAPRTPEPFVPPTPEPFPAVTPELGFDLPSDFEPLTPVSGLPDLSSASAASAPPARTPVHPAPMPPPPAPSPVVPPRVASPVVPPPFAPPAPAVVARPEPMPPPFVPPLAAAAPPPLRGPSRGESGPAADAGEENPALADLLEGAGLTNVQPSAELARSFGQIFRVVVSGVMDVMQARQQVKDEFRMQMTHFRTADNNPLKFSANVDDALHNLLVKRNAAYLGPVEAFEDAFDDLRHHQLAVLAGMRVAFDALLKEFDPDRLEQEFDRQSKQKRWLDAVARSRYWELYRERLAQMTRDPDACFSSLFGEEFARAYEEQLKRLKAQSRERAAAKRAAAGTPPDRD